MAADASYAAAVSWSVEQEITGGTANGSWSDRHIPLLLEQE